METLKEIREEALSVSQFNQAVASALSGVFPGPFWIIGEIAGYERGAQAAKTKKWGQVYFELVEKEDGKDQIKARVKAMIWGEAHEVVQGKLKSAAPMLALSDGLEVRFLCRLDYYWKWGELRVVVEDVDPEFTLGQMERVKRELIKKLKAAGLLEKNRQNLLPCPSLEIGLITAEGSAAYHDFYQELKSSGYAFRIYFWPSAMQGEAVEADVTQGLRALQRIPAVEAIVIARGGGSRSDLIWFDKEAIALAIAHCSKPVLTGIGHEIDQSVADLTAYKSFKTPTAIAAFLVQQCRQYELDLMQMARSIVDTVRHELEQASLELTRDARAFLSECRRHLHVARERLHWTVCGIPQAVKRVLAQRQEDCAIYPARLARAAQTLLCREQERLQALERECRLKDPARLLARGWSLLQDENGVMIKRARALRPGAPFQAHLVDGLIEARTEKTTLFSKGDMHG